jgi:outer membrane protein assembly factor BamE (lipoprotein component of BamABCDE complex)
VFSGCHSHRVQYKKVDGVVSFETPFGLIKRGDSMTEVAKILGNPHNVSQYKRREIWEYDFKNKGKIFVYFLEGSVAKVYLE